MKILIVDDSYSWQEYHKNAIEEIFIELGIENYAIDTADWAREGYDCLLQNNEKPYDIIITDLQMENDFSPKYAGEWFVEQVRTFKTYINTKIIISSGAYNIKQIAESFGVNYIPKRIAVTDINRYKTNIINLLN